VNNKKVKIAVDIFMVIFMALSFVRWEDSNFAFHAAVGGACVLFFATHIIIHRKWIKAVTKSCFTGKANKTLLAKYTVDMLLLIVWGVSIITGFIAIAPFFDKADWGFAWGRFHGITTRVGLGLVVIHVIQHIPQITSYFGIKKRKKNIAQ
jgi:hypothetical protein